MLDLNEKVFGNVTSQQIIGSEPTPAETENLLQNEFAVLTQNLDGLEKSQLTELKEKQQELEKQVNSRPGAMALSQEKIRLYVKYSQNYIQKIDEILKQTK